MTDARLSLPRERIPILLLEGIHERAVEFLVERGYSNVRRLGHLVTDLHGKGDRWDLVPDFDCHLFKRSVHLPRLECRYKPLRRRGQRELDDERDHYHRRRTGRRGLG